MKKKELILIGSILAAAAILSLAMAFFRRSGSESIRITVAGEEYGTWPLSEEQTIEIGSTNVCEIKNGRAVMTEADCPDHLCMEQAPIDENGGVIVCLPNQVIIEGTGSADDSDEEAVDVVM